MNKTKPHLLKNCSRLKNYGEQPDQRFHHRNHQDNHHRCCHPHHHHLMFAACLPWWLRIITPAKYIIIITIIIIIIITTIITILIIIITITVSCLPPLPPLVTENNYCRPLNTQEGRLEEETDEANFKKQVRRWHNQRIIIEWYRKGKTKLAKLKVKKCRPS